MHLIVFDLDGTLVDSQAIDEPCYLKTAEDPRQSFPSSNKNRLGGGAANIAEETAAIAAI